MIAHLRGTILTKSPNQLILDCGGVGYDISISVSTFSALPDPGSEARLHIYTRVAEDALALFGFAELPEKRLFEKLISISGIGPKLAITVLSGVSSPQLVAAIRSGDHATLVKVPGIGKKTAERVVLELKDKLEDLAAMGPDTPEPAPGPHSEAGDDTLSALLNLGYQRAAALKAIETALKEDPTRERSFEALFRASMARIR